MLDVIVRIANIVNPSKKELADYFTEQSGKKVELEVLRNGSRKTVTLNIPRKKINLRALISQISVDDKNAVVADVVANSPADKLNIHRGAQITACNGRSVVDWCDIVEYLRTSCGQQVELTWRFGDSEFNGTLQVPDDLRWAENIDYAVDMIPYPFETIIQDRNPVHALALGIRQTWYFIKLVYVSIRRIVIDQTVDASEVGGPIFIIHTGKTIAEAGMFRLLYFLALISANLAVINFLPVPITDGGLMLLLCYEKIRGKPVPAKAAAIWQTVGLALIILAFVAIIYNDIRRIIMGE